LAQRDFSVIDRGKRNVLGVLVNAIDYQATVHQVILAAQEHQPLAVSALAVHGVMTGVMDPIQRYRLNHLDLVVPDGQPVRWALNHLYDTALPDRVYGPTLMLKVCQEASCERLPIYLYGSREVVLKQLAKNLRERFPDLCIAGYQPSRFRRLSIEEQIETVRMIRNSTSRLVFVGLGCPRQEVWAYENRALLSMPILAVGAAFDFHAGLLAQAPVGWQSRGLEWLYRLLREPHRLWRRYLFLNPLYLLLVGLQLAHLGLFDPNAVTPPAAEMRYG
jgi:N-acetylglucosaminyldiphosphoundecaprenol N-acetyl-beta-D-mannosaminyltransferase